MLIDSLVLEDDKKHTNMDTEVFHTLLMSTSDQIRTLTFIQVKKDDDENTLEITAVANQKLGLKFESKPPRVSFVNETSPFQEKGVKVGMVVKSLTLENGNVYDDIDGKELT